MRLGGIGVRGSDILRAVLLGDYPGRGGGWENDKTWLPLLRKGNGSPNWDGVKMEIRGNGWKRL